MADTTGEVVVLLSGKLPEAERHCRHVAMNVVALMPIDRDDQRLDLFIADTLEQLACDLRDPEHPSGNRETGSYDLTVNGVEAQGRVSWEMRRGSSDGVVE